MGWSVRICFSSIFIIKTIRFHILSGEAYLCRLFTVFHGGRCGYVSPTDRIAVPDSSDRRPRNNIRNSDWSFSYSVVSRVFVPIVHRLSRWSVRICFSSILFKIKIIRFHILSGEAHLCRLRTVFHGGRCEYVSPTVRIAVPDSSDRRPRVAYLCRLFTVFHGSRCGYVFPQQYSSF